MSHFLPLGMNQAWNSNHELLLACTGPVCISGESFPSPGCRGPSSRMHINCSVGWISAPTSYSSFVPCLRYVYATVSAVAVLHKKPRMHLFSGEQKEGRQVGMQLEPKEGTSNRFCNQLFFSGSDPSGNRTRSCRASKAVQKAEGSRWVGILGDGWVGGYGWGEPQ